MSVYIQVRLFRPSTLSGEEPRTTRPPRVSECRGWWVSRPTLLGGSTLLPIQRDLRQFLEPPKTRICHLLAQRIHLGVKSSIQNMHPEVVYFPKASLFLLSFPVVRAPQWSTRWLFKTPGVDKWLMDYMAVASSLPEAAANSSNESSCHYCFLSACWNCPGPHFIHRNLPCSHFNKSPVGPPQMSFWSPQGPCYWS